MDGMHMHALLIVQLLPITITRHTNTRVCRFLHSILYLVCLFCTYDGWSKEAREGRVGGSMISLWRYFAHTQRIFANPNIACFVESCEGNIQCVLILHARHENGDQDRIIVM